MSALHAGAGWTVIWPTMFERSNAPNGRGWLNEPNKTSVKQILQTINFTNMDQTLNSVLWGFTSLLPPLSPFPHANRFVIGTAVINTHSGWNYNQGRYIHHHNTSWINEHISRVEHTLSRVGSWYVYLYACIPCLCMPRRWHNASSSACRRCL